jgi:MFS family permease
VAVLLATGIVADMQGVVLSPLIGVMTKDLNLTSSQVSWTLNALLLGGAISVGLTSRLGDHIGHKKVLLPLSVLGLIGAVLAATAHGFVPIAAGRFLMGVAVCTPLAWGLIRPRATASQVQGISVALATAIVIFTPLSLVLGGALLKAGLGWQTAFWIVAAGYSVMILSLLVSPESPEAVRVRVPLDWAGVIGLGVWLTALLLSISEGPSRGWTSGYVLTGFAVAVVVFVMWTVQQARARTPLMDFQGMDLRQVISGYTGVCSISISAAALFIYLPALLQTPTRSGYGFGLSTFQASLPLLMILPGALIAGWWTKAGLPRFGPKRTMVSGAAVGSLAFFGMSLAHSELWLIYTWVLVYAAGIIVCWNAGWALVAASGRQDNTSITFGVQYVTQNLAAAITTALVIVSLTPGSNGLIPESAYRVGFLAVGIVILAFIAVWLVVLPDRLVDRHAPSS